MSGGADIGGGSEFGDGDGEADGGCAPPGGSDGGLDLPFTGLVEVELGDVNPSESEREFGEGGGGELGDSAGG